LLAGGGKWQSKLDRDIFPQIAAYALERRQGDGARRMAQAIYKGMTGEFARVAWDQVKPVEPTPEVRSRILAEQIRFSKGTAKVSRPAPRRMPENWGETRAAT
jgi:hypothetical protein